MPVYPMGLPHIEEPVHVKSRIKQLWQVMCNGSTIDCDMLVVWSNNELPKYLWDRWSNVLKHHGYSWQKFLKALRLTTRDMILWALKDSLTWDELIERIAHTLEIYSGGGG